MSKYKLNKRCIKCNKLLLDKNKSGFCNSHRDRTGSNNSFFGKHHSKETIDGIKAKNRKKSKENWKKKEYRDKVIKGTSKPRKESFKKEQSDRIKLWYKDNPKQKDIRSIHMKKSWKNGLIPKSKHTQMNKSKIQNEFFNDIKDIYPFVSDNTTIKYDSKWLFPDISIIKDGIIVEFLGDYWHANPNKYKENDIVHHELTALEIWKNDERRKSTFERLGFFVYTVWESDYKKDKRHVLNTFDSILNWEGCSI